MTPIVFLFFLLVVSVPSNIVSFHTATNVNVKISIPARLMISSKTGSSPFRNSETIFKVISRNSLFLSSASRRSSISLLSVPVGDASHNAELSTVKPKPKDLFAKFGIAYLLTSITLSIISYATCYYLVGRGVDVGALLAKVGIEATATSANTGTAAIAYAMHKAASPIRFPPTVALTPFVAKLIGYQSPPKTSNTTGRDAKF